MAIHIVVLILIILEYIYILSLTILSIITMCLNPYYTGIHLHTDWRNELLRRRCVLILIILEYIYILIKGDGF